MKIADKLILISGLAYGILFYQQDAGLNLFLFTLIQLVGIYFWVAPEKRTTRWWIAFGGGVIAAISVLLYGSALSVWANISALIVLVSLTYESKSSVLIGLINGVYTGIFGVVHLINDIATRAMNKTVGNQLSKRFKSLAIFGASATIVLVFIGLYRNSNSTFKQLTDAIDLSFISMEWLGFTLLGYYLVYVLYAQKSIGKLRKIDAESKNELTREMTEEEKGFVSLGTEKQWAKMLLIMLNTLLFIVLIGDIADMLGLVDNTKGAEENHSANVHQGINSLIFSIVLAVGILLFFFRGKINFVEGSKLLKGLAITWMALNIVLVISTGAKNVAYVQEFFLTYKRIGVFFYLFFCLIGLFYTYIKIRDTKTNWFLLRSVSWGIYLVAMLTPLVNWDALIINYNFEAAKENPENLDLEYLMNLPTENHPLIYGHLQKSETSIEALILLEQERVDSFVEYYSQLDWRSFNFRSHFAYKDAINN